LLALLLTHGERKRPGGGVLAQQELAESRVDTSANHSGVRHGGASE
jgi:hypothetical protein